MQEGSLNHNNAGTSFAQRLFHSANNPHVSITSFQNVPRTQSPSLLNHPQESSQGLRHHFSNAISNLGPLMHQARNSETNGRSLKFWLKRANHSEPCIRSNMSDSTVINFEDLHEPSTSYSRPFYGNPVRKAISEQCQIDFSQLEVTGENVNQNFVNQIQENNRTVALHNINLNSDNSSRNSNANIPVSQTNEGANGENPNLTPVTENQAVDKLFNKYLPFITFLFIKAIYDHREGILIFVGLLVTFTHANSVVKREVAKQNRRSLLSLGILFINLFVCICFIYFVFKDQKLYKNLIFIPPYSQLLSIWDLLWMVGITDFVLKFITIQLKVGMACFPAKFIPYSSRGKWYLMLESTSQLYRGLVPIQPWLYYLTEVYQGPENAVGMFFSVAYMVSKGSDLTSKVKLFMKAFWKLVQSANLGVRPNKEELDTAGSQCPICHDEFNSPIILHCRHVFCEACVSTWFDREQTCPLCRAKIVDDPSWRDGATSFFTQLF